MSKNSGIIVKYAKRNGDIQYGIMRHIDQEDAFKAVNKCLIRLCDKEFDPVKNEHGEELTTLKSPEKLTIIGHID